MICSKKCGRRTRRSFLKIMKSWQRLTAEEKEKLFSEWNILSDAEKQLLRMQEKSEQSIQEKRQQVREILKKLRQQRLDRKRLSNDKTATGADPTVAKTKNPRNPRTQKTHLTACQDFPIPVPAPWLLSEPAAGTDAVTAHFFAWLPPTKGPFPQASPVLCFCPVSAKPVRYRQSGA